MTDSQEKGKDDLASEAAAAADEAKAAADEAADAAKDAKASKAACPGGSKSDEEGITVDEFWGDASHGADVDEFGYETKGVAKPKLDDERAAANDAAKADAAKADESPPGKSQGDSPRSEEPERVCESSEPVAGSSQATDDGKSKAPQAKAGGSVRDGVLGEVLITANGLSKYYGPFKAIEDVSFEVRRGQVVAFLGPNGAGKSTTMKILTGVIAPDRGSAEIAGLSVIDDRLQVATRLGYLPENGPLYEDMTPASLLRFLGEARGMAPDRIEGRLTILSDRLHLSTVMGKPIHKLSRGFRQRVGLAQALIHEPDVLIMDEPTAGLDPNQIRDVRRVIREFGRDKAVLLSTHILHEAEAIADWIVFIHEGEIVFKGTVEALREHGETLEEAFAVKTGTSTAAWSET